MRAPAHRNNVCIQSPLKNPRLVDFQCFSRTVTSHDRQNPRRALAYR